MGFSLMVTDQVLSVSLEPISIQFSTNYMPDLTFRLKIEPPSSLDEQIPLPGQLEGGTLSALSMCVLQGSSAAQVIGSSAIEQVVQQQQLQQRRHHHHHHHGHWHQQQQQQYLTTNSFPILLIANTEESISDIHEESRAGIPPKG